MQLSVVKENIITMLVSLGRALIWHVRQDFLLSNVSNALPASVQKDSIGRHTRVGLSVQKGPQQLDPMSERPCSGMLQN